MTDGVQFEVCQRAPKVAGGHLRWVDRFNYARRILFTVAHNDGGNSEI